MKHGLNTDFQNHCGMDDWRERARLACGFGRRARTIGGTIQFGKRFSARRRKRQPGRSRSPAKTQLVAVRQHRPKAVWGGRMMKNDGSKWACARSMAMFIGDNFAGRGILAKKISVKSNDTPKQKKQRA